MLAGFRRVGVVTYWRQARRGSS